MSATYPVQHRRGVHLPLADLWLDPLEHRALAVVSHAHGDHIGRHGEVICTQATWRVMRHRLGGGSRPPGLRRRPLPERPRPWRGALPRVLAHGEPVERGDAVISLHPAGHVLGSSQVLVQHRGVRVLYSGDVRLRRGRTAEPVEHVECDVLVVEATFGRPQYVFPPPDEVARAIVDFCLDAVDAGATPVLLGYSFGKGQELMACLAGAGLPIVLHGSLHDIAALYRDLGVDLPPAARLGEAPLPERCVLIVPPHLRRSRRVERLQPRRLAAVTGWALDGWAEGRLGVDAAFPMSDHAGFDELLTYVERSGARRVYTVFGFAEDLAHQLRRRGIDASPLAQQEQLALALA